MNFRFLFISILFCICSFGQTPEIVKSMFYNLPLDSSLTVGCKAARHGDKFSETNCPGPVFAPIPIDCTYYGKINSNYFISSKPDSANIEIIWGGTVSYRKMFLHKKEEVTEFATYEISYYFSSFAVADSEYSNCIRSVQTLKNDSFTFGLNYSEDSIIRMNSCHGMEFYSSKKIKTRYPYLHIQIISFKNNTYALQLDFEKPDGISYE